MELYFLNNDWYSLKIVTLLMCRNYFSLFLMYILKYLTRCRNSLQIFGRPKTLGACKKYSRCGILYIISTIEHVNRNVTSEQNSVIYLDLKAVYVSSSFVGEVAIYGQVYLSIHVDNKNKSVSIRGIIYLCCSIAVIMWTTN